MGLFYGVIALAKCETLLCSFRLPVVCFCLAAFIILLNIFSAGDRLYSVGPSLTFKSYDR